MIINSSQSHSLFINPYKGSGNVVDTLRVIDLPLSQEMLLQARDTRGIYGKVVAFSVKT